MAKPVTMTTALRRKRLLKLADFLEHFKPTKTKKFNMREWGKHTGEHPPNEKNWCGTTACALGWAVTIPAFTRAGLKFDWDQWPSKEGSVWTASIEYGGCYDEYAGKKFFGLTSSEMCTLFFGNGNAKRVAERCRSIAEDPYAPEDVGW